MRAIIDFAVYMLPACLFLGVIVAVMAWSIRANRNNVARAEECLLLTRDTKNLLEELVRLQRETNRLLTERQETPKA